MRVFLAALFFCFCSVSAFAAWPTDYESAPITRSHSFARVMRKVRAEVTAPVNAARSEIYELVSRAARSAGVPLDIAHAIVRMESDYNPHAHSSAGAVGIMQVLPRTAAEMGENPYSLDGNLRAGMKYLRRALDSSSDLCAAISGYEHGINGRPYCTAYGRRVLAMARH